MKQSSLRWMLASLAVLAVICSGCGGSEPNDATNQPAMTEADVSRAESLFQSEACSVCHGDAAEGLEGAGPALVDLEPYWNVERLSAYIRDPGGFRAANPDFEERRDVEYELEMPAADHLSEDQRRLLARWLLTR